MGEMAELFLSYSWKTLLLVLLVFGTAPGVILRLLVLAYPKGHPRRRELIAQLYTVPRAERPMWVAEQIEVALCEGLPLRWRARQARPGSRRPSPLKRIQWWGFPALHTVATVVDSLYFYYGPSDSMLLGVLALLPNVGLWVVVLRRRRNARQTSDPPK
jgi:hypothetical protein